MNQQIRLLAEQAGIHDDVCSMCPIHELDKFARLIINECIDQVAGTKIVDPGVQHAQWNNALVIATMNVRDHFGAKE